MLRWTLVRLDTTTTFRSLGRLPLRAGSSPRYEQHHGKPLSGSRLAAVASSSYLSSGRRENAQKGEIRAPQEQGLALATSGSSDTSGGETAHTRTREAMREALRDPTRELTGETNRSTLSSLSYGKIDSRGQVVASRKGNQGGSEVVAKVRRKQPEMLALNLAALYTTTNSAPSSRTAALEKEREEGCYYAETSRGTHKGEGELRSLRPKRQAAGNTAPKVGTQTQLAGEEATEWSLGVLRCVSDDDVVLDTPASLLNLLSASFLSSSTSTVNELRDRKMSHHHHRQDEGNTALPELHNPAGHPSARGVGQDVIDLVTDAFRERREVEVQKRREVLYALTHPVPSDYTYKGKLVPPPPLSFGQITSEARELGNRIMLHQQYSLVNQASTRATDTPTSSPHATTATANLIETCGPSSSSSSRAGAKGKALVSHRGRKRDTNIFRDHNYFFEINELYQEIVLVGKACAGKSSLLNALLGQNVARTSSTPNTTRFVSFYQSVTPEELQAFHAKERHNLVKLPGGGLQLTFVDMPGFGIEGMSDKWRDAAIELTDAYFGVRRSVNTVLFCVDCERGLTKVDVRYFEWLENIQGVFYVVLTKCDSVPHSRVCSVMRQIYALITKHRRKYRKVFPFIIPVSAKDGTNIEMLRGLIMETSGMLPGDKLRDLLKQKQTEVMKGALLAEAQRLEAARELERRAARNFFLESHGGSESSADIASFEGVIDDTSGGEVGDAVDTPATGSVLGELQYRQPGGDDDQQQHQLQTPPQGQMMSRSNSNRRVEVNFGDHSRGITSSFDNSSGGGTKRTVDDERARRRREFLQWRAQHPLERSPSPYSSVEYRVNTGIENPTSTLATIDYGDVVATAAAVETRPQEQTVRERGKGKHEVLNATAAAEMNGEGAMAPSQILRRESSRVIGLFTSENDDNSSAAASVVGENTRLSSSSLSCASSSQACSSAPPATVSRFLDTLERFSKQEHNADMGRRTTREKERRWRQRYAPHFLAEEADGRLAEYRGGVRCGPSLVASAIADSPLTTLSAVATRKAAWKAEQLRGLLVQENAEAPWSALQDVSRKIESQKEAQALGRMKKKKDLAAYLRNAGSVTESFEKFEGEVTAAKCVNEIRQALTLRSREQMHLNATAKINYRSMPPGLWKRYGEKDTYWPTPHVIGRENDESHTPPRTHLARVRARQAKRDGRQRK